MPVTSSIIAIAATAASTYAAYESQRQASKGRQRAAEYNAAVARNEVISARQQAMFRADRIRERNRRVLASQRAALARSGVSLSGSAADLAYDSAIQGELDALATIYVGETEARRQEGSATLLDATARNERRSRGYSAFGTAMQGAGSIAGQTATLLDRT